MADIGWVWDDSVIIGPKLDQLKAEAWDFLRDQGDEWTWTFDALTQKYIKSEDEIQRAVGLLVQVGLLYMCESYHFSE